MFEQSRLQRYELRMEWPLAAVALAFLALFSIDVLYQPQGTVDHIVKYAMFLCWGVFCADYLIRLGLAEARLKWFVRHLLDLAIIALPALRPLRLLSLTVVINVLQRAIGHTIRGKVIVYTVCGAVVIIYSASLAILEAERGVHPDHAFANLGDALWWSVTTVTTVGYGDTVPSTVTGRFVAVALMIAGVSLLGVVTATLASWIVERVAAEDTSIRAATAAQIDELRDEIRQLSEALSRSAPGDPSPANGESGNRGDRTGSTAHRGDGHNSLT